VLDLPNDLGWFVFEQAQSELVPAKARCHLAGATTLLNEQGETRKKSINGLLAVAVVERMEIVYIEEHQRDPLVGRQRSERGNEFLGVASPVARSISPW
jgi:hypothetical protein